MNQQDIKDTIRAIWINTHGTETYISLAKVRTRFAKYDDNPGVTRAQIDKALVSLLANHEARMIPE